MDAGLFLKDGQQKGEEKMLKRLGILGVVAEVLAGGHALAETRIKCASTKILFKERQAADQYLPCLVPAGRAMRR